MIKKVAFVVMVYVCVCVCLSNVNSYSIEDLLHFHTAASPNWKAKESVADKLCFLKQPR
jgi:hypothetical protein